MQYLSDDNMDELFRRAADDYPLKTNKPDWDKVSHALQTEDAAKEADDAKKKTSYRKLLWLLLLLPFVWICNGKYFMNDSKFSDDNIALKKPLNPKTSSATKNADSKKDETTKVAKSSLNEEKIKLQKNVQPLASDNTIKRKVAINHDKILLSLVKPNNNSTALPDQSKRSTKAINKNNMKNGFSISPKMNKNEKEENDFSIHNKKEPINPVANNSNASEKNKDAVEKNNVDQSTDAPMNHESNNGNMQNNDQQKTTPSVISAEKAINKNDSIQNKTGQSLSKQKHDQPEKNKNHSLYGGIVGGFDVSTVKFQSVKNTGFSAGILLGYQLNKRLSVETGFLYDKKFYYTDAKYFDMKNIYVPPNVNILNMNGNCYMFELPINVKYNWSTTAKSNWFSTLGLSTYFMKKENYNYAYEYTGSSWPMNYSKSYDNSPTNWFGVINLSAGYMHTLGKAGSIRVEPYVKIPVQGLGIGSLSIWSTGVYVSFIKTIFSK